MGTYARLELGLDLEPSSGRRYEEVINFFQESPVERDIWVALLDLSQICTDQFLIHSEISDRAWTLISTSGSQVGLEMGKENDQHHDNIRIRTLLADNQASLSCMDGIRRVLYGLLH